MAVKIIDFPKIHDPRGNLTFLQCLNQIPFTIKRIFWTYNVPGGEKRGGHAFRKQQEVIIALSGSFDVVITYPDGRNEKYALNRSYYGLFVPQNTWRHIENFSTNALSLHISSEFYTNEDYIRDFNDYKTLYEASKNNSIRV
jgi:hypothetical protein